MNDRLVYATSSDANVTSDIRAWIDATSSSLRPFFVEIDDYPAERVTFLFVTPSVPHGSSRWIEVEKLRDEFCDFLAFAPIEWFDIAVTKSGVILVRSHAI